MKTCRKCAVEFESIRCTACNKASYAAWRLSNLEKDKATKAAYRAANPEKAKADTAAWAEVNQERLTDYRAAYRLLNAEKARAKSSSWRRENPAKRRASNHNRRAKLAGCEGSHTAEEVKELYELQRGMCVVCRVDISGGYHEDHIVSLVNGGSNDIYNIQLLCAPCNLSKHAKHPVDFMQSKGYLL